MKILISDLGQLKKFRNPPGLSFKTVTDLPKFTYSIQTTPVSINDFFDFDNIQSTTESVPRYTYKVRLVKRITAWVWVQIHVEI